MIREPQKDHKYEIVYISLSRLERRGCFHWIKFEVSDGTKMEKNYFNRVKFSPVESMFHSCMYIEDGSIPLVYGDRDRFCDRFRDRSQ